MKTFSSLLNVGVLLPIFLLNSFHIITAVSAKRSLKDADGYDGVSDDAPTLRLTGSGKLPTSNLESTRSPAAEYYTSSCTSDSMPPYTPPISLTGKKSNPKTKSIPLATRNTLLFIVVAFLSLFSLSLAGSLTETLAKRKLSVENGNSGKPRLIEKPVVIGQGYLDTASTEMVSVFPTSYRRLGSRNLANLNADSTIPHAIHQVTNCSRLEGVADTIFAHPQFVLKFDISVAAQNVFGSGELMNNLGLSGLSSLPATNFYACGVGKVNADAPRSWILTTSENCTFSESKNLLTQVSECDVQFLTTTAQSLLTKVNGIEGFDPSFFANVTNGSSACLSSNQTLPPLPSLQSMVSSLGGGSRRQLETAVIQRKGRRLRKLASVTPPPVITVNGSVCWINLVPVPVTPQTAMTTAVVPDSTDGDDLPLWMQLTLGFGVPLAFAWCMYNYSKTSGPFKRFKRRRQSYGYSENDVVPQKPPVDPKTDSNIGLVWPANIPTNPTQPGRKNGNSSSSSSSSSDEDEDETKSNGGDDDRRRKRKSRKKRNLSITPTAQNPTPDVTCSPIPRRRGPYHFLASKIPISIKRPMLKITSSLRRTNKTKSTKSSTDRKNKELANRLGVENDGDRLAKLSPNTRRKKLSHKESDFRLSGVFSHKEAANIAIIGRTSTVPGSEEVFDEGDYSRRQILKEGRRASREYAGSLMKSHVPRVSPNSEEARKRVVMQMEIAKERGRPRSRSNSRDSTGSRSRSPSRGRGTMSRPNSADRTRRPSSSTSPGRRPSSAGRRPSSAGSRSHSQHIGCTHGLGEPCPRMERWERRVSEIKQCEAEGKRYSASEAGSDDEGATIVEK